MAIVDIIELIKPETGEKFYPFAHINGVKGAELLPRIGSSVQTTLPTPIFQIKDALNAQFYPQTHAEAVIGLAQMIEDNQFFVKESDGNGGFRIKLKDEFTGFYADSWLAAGGVGSGGSGGGIIETVRGVADLNTPIVSESLTETFSAKAIQTIWDAVKTLQQSTPNVSLVNGANNSTLTVNGTTADFYTKLQIDAIVGAVYRPAGNAATVSELGTLTATNIGKVYNMTAAFTTTADFLEGAGKTFPAGTNVVIVDAGSGTYKYDVLSGFVDLSGYALLTDIPTSLSQLSDDSTHRLVTDTQMNNWNDAYDGLRIYDLEDNGTTTAGAWMGKNAKITALTDGLMVRYKVTVAGASTTKLTVNSLGAKTVYRYGSTKLADAYGVGSYLVLYYSSSLNSGCWMVLTNYDANNYAYVRQYVATDNVEYSLLARYTTASVETYETKYTKFADAVTLNPSTGKLTANGFKVTGGSGFLKADGTSGALVSTDIPDLSDTYVTVAGVQTITGAKSFAEAITLSGSTNTARRIYFGDTNHYLELDQYGFHFSHGVYSEDFVSAGGIGNGGGSGSATELGDLVDVSLSTRNNGDLLVYNSATSHWENKPQSSIIPSVSIGFNDLTSHPTTISGYGITDANIANGTITIGANTITPITTETDPTVPSWAKAQSKPSYSLSEISGTSDLQAIEALAGTSGLLRKTAANTWSLDTNPYVYEVNTQGDGFLDFVHNNGDTTRIDLNHEHSNYVPITRTINGSPLSQDITITAQGLGVASWAMGSGSGSTIPFNVLPSLFVARTPITDTAANGTLLGIDAISNAASSGNSDTSRFAWDSVNGAWHFLGNLYVDGWLAAGGIGAGSGGGYGVEQITSNEDGTVDFHFSGGDVTTVDLNHEHPQYASKMAGTSQPSGGFLPDVVYELGTLTGSVTFALASAVSGQVNHYFWTFTAGSTAPIVTWPSGITWVDSAPTITAGNKYQISILDGVAAYMEA